MNTEQVHKYIENYFYTLPTYTDVGNAVANGLKFGDCYLNSEDGALMNIVYMSRGEVIENKGPKYRTAINDFFKNLPIHFDVQTAVDNELIIGSYYLEGSGFGHGATPIALPVMRIIDIADLETPPNQQ